MINTRAMPTTQTAITGVSPPIPAGQEIRTRQCRGPGSRGQVWARTVAVIAACLSMLANFLWLPYYPWWALLIIAFDVFVIWAVTAHGRDLSDLQ